MELKILSKDTAQILRSLEVNEKFFSREFNEPLVHQVVTGYLTALRQGTKAQKTRSEVRGGGKKPWKQKGTGRARAGSIRSPLWRGGGKIFAATPRNYTQKINKKMYKIAMQSILSELIRQDRLLILDSFSFHQPKTKDILNMLKKLGLPIKSVLFVTDTEDDNFYLSARNLVEIEVVSVECLDPASLVHFEKVVFTAVAIKNFEETLQ